MNLSVKTSEINSCAGAFRFLVESRRAVRRFKTEKIPDSVIKKCLELAILAPSSCNLQPWSFEVVRDPVLLQKLHPVCLKQSASKAPLIVVILARPDTWRAACAGVLENWQSESVPAQIERFYSKIAPFQYNQGRFGFRGLFKRVAIWYSGLRLPVMRGPNSIKAMNLWAVKSTALAAQNLILAFQSHGYSTCPMEGFDEKRLRSVLPIPKQSIPIMLLSVGVAADNGVFNSRVRFPLEQCVNWH